MATRPWYEIEDILRSKGFGEDDLFGFKQNYFDNLIEDRGYDPEDEELKRKRKLFLYGNEKEWELLKAAKSGFIRGLGEVPETAADVIEINQKIFPGDSERVNAVEESLRGEAQRIRDAAGPFQPSSFGEKLASGLSAVPGTVASMAPFTAAAAAAAPADIGVLGAAGVGALGFGAYEAVRSARGTWEDIGKGAVKGAALGAILGTGSAITRGVGKGTKNALLADLKGRAAGAAASGGGAGLFSAATGESPEDVAQTAATFALLSATHRNLYNKVRKTAEKAGVTDPKAVDQIFESKIEADDDVGAFLKRKRDVQKRQAAGETTEPIAARASELEAESGIPFNVLTGGLPWGSRIKRIRKEGPLSKIELTKKLHDDMSLLEYEKEKAKRDDPSIYDENGNVRKEFKDEMDYKMGSFARNAQLKIQEAPDVRQGAQYGVYDPSGQQLLYTIERVDWKRNSPNQWELRDARDQRVNPKFFKNLSNAEGYLSKVLEADPEMPMGAVFNRGVGLANSDNRLLRMYGRSMLNFYAKKMGKAELAQSTMPMSQADVVLNLGKVWGTPVQQGIIRAVGKYSPKHGNITLASLRNIKAMFHEIGHEVTSLVLKSRFPKGPNEDEIAYGNRISNMFRSPNSQTTGLGSIFDAEELEVLYGLGVKEYTPLGAVKPIPIGNETASSYEAEGISAYFRMKLYGEKPENVLTPRMLNSPEGQRVLQKLESWYRGVDPRDPTNPVEIPGMGAKMQESAKIFDLFRQQNPMEHTEAMISGTRGGLMTNPLHELGKAITQNWFSHNKYIVDLQKTIWPLINDTVGKVSKIPDWRNLDLITQFIPSSAIGQMGRHGIFNGVIPMVTGEIKIKPFTQAVAESGLIDKIPKKRDQEKLVNHYFWINRLAETQEQIKAYDDSRRALTDAKFANDAALRGEKLMSLGEIRETKMYIEKLREEYGPLLSDMSDGKVILDPVAERARLNALYPNAIKLLDWETEFNAARELMNKPLRAGGSGLFRKLGKVGLDSDPEKLGPEDFGGKGLDVREQLSFAINKHKKFSWAERIRRNALLDSVEEFKDPLQAGGHIIKGVDFWGTGKKRDVFTEFVMKLEEAHKESNFNRQMNEIYDVIAGQRLAGLSIGSIPDTTEVEAGIKTGKLDPHKEMLVSFRKAGRKKWIQFDPNNPEGVRAFRAVTKTGPFLMGNRWADLILGGPKRMMVLGTTGANAGFLLYTNLWRDSLTSAIQSEIRGRRGVIGAVKSLKTFAPFLVRANMEILRLGPNEALARASKRGTEQFEMTKSLLRYQSSGVKGSSLIGEDQRSRAAAASEAYMRSKYISATIGGTDRKTATTQYKIHTIFHPIDAIREIFTISEDLNRFPEYYMTQKEFDANNQEYFGPRATKRAAEVSIDFKRAGIYSRLLNEMIPFFNPSLQGLNKFSRVLFKDQKPSLKNINGGAIAIAGQAIALPTLGLWAMNRDEEWYKELPTWEKLMFWHAKVGDTVLRVPVPFEWGLFFGTLPVAVYDSIYNDAPERVREQMDIALKQIIPWGFVDNIPQLLKPAFEAYANKNSFTDIPIESKAMERRLPQDRYTENTLGIYKGAAELATMLHAPELLRSPVMIEHLTRGYLGSVVNGLLHDLEGAVTGDVGAIKKGLIFSRAISPTDRPGQSVQDFYNKMDLADKAWNTAKRRIESGDKAAAAKILNKYKSKIGLSAQDIRRIIVSGDVNTPQSLLEMHRAALKMAELRKEDEDKAMTETAQAILGRDWE